MLGQQELSVHVKQPVWWQGLAGVVLVGLAAWQPASAVAAEGPPNILLILVDDLGWTDLGCFGSRFYETPHIDRLASQGMKFTQAYSACTVCSPTRAAILTGKYPARLHLTDWIAGHVRPQAKLQVPDWTRHLPLEERNIARALKPGNYATASIGKWHLGKEPFYPDQQGFDLNVGGCDKGQPPSYFSPYRIPTLTDGPPGEFLSDRLTTEAIKFMEQNQDRPFFVYLPHYAVHTPLMAKPEVLEKYQQKAQPAAPHTNAVYAGLIESVDDSVGRLLKKLDELKLAERTILIFTSDNGGLLPVTSNVPLRAGKGSAYEGGVRVPLIVKWPGVTKPGSRCDTPVISVDYLPTMLEMAGVQADAPQVVDGESLVPLLQQTGGLTRDTLYWHYPHYHPGGATPYSAIRQGDFKLIEFFEDQHVELYNLQDDIGEQHDLAEKLPDQAQALRTKLAAWRSQVGAQLPTPNPDYDPNAMTERKPQPKKPAKK
jgi:arylsulfatase A